MLHLSICFLSSHQWMTYLLFGQFLNHSFWAIGVKMDGNLCFYIILVTVFNLWAVVYFSDKSGYFLLKYHIEAVTPCSAARLPISYFCAGVNDKYSPRDLFFFSSFPWSASRTFTLAEAIAVTGICSLKGPEGSDKFWFSGEIFQDWHLCTSGL